MEYNSNSNILLHNIFNDNLNIFEYSSKGEKIIYHQSSIEDKNIKSSTINIDKNFDFISFINLDNNLNYLFANQYDEVSNNFDFYISDLSKENTNSNYKKIFDIPSNPKNRFDTKVCYSNDKSKIGLLLTKTHKNNNLQRDLEFYIIVFDTNMKELYRKSYNYNNQFQKLKVSNFWISNDGYTIFDLNNIDLNNGEFSIVVLNKKGLEVRDSKVNYPNFRFNNILGEIYNDTLELYSLYSKNTNSNKLEGAVIINLNIKNKDSIIYNTIDFDSNFYNRILKKTDIEKNKSIGIDRNYLLNKVYKFSNDEYIFISEKFTVECFESGSYSFNNIPMSSTRYCYNNFDNILTFSLSKNNLKWTDIYLKSQRIKSNSYIDYEELIKYKKNTIIDFPFSFYSYLYDNEINILFNDVSENYELQMNDKNMLEKKTISSTINSNYKSILYTINKFTGDEIIEKANYENNNKIIIPLNCKEINSNTHLLYRSDLKTFNYGILEYQKGK